MDNAVEYITGALPSFNSLLRFYNCISHAAQKLEQHKLQLQFTVDYDTTENYFVNFGRIKKICIVIRHEKIEINVAVVFFPVFFDVQKRNSNFKATVGLDLETYAWKEILCTLKPHKILQIMEKLN